VGDTFALSSCALAGLGGHARLALGALHHVLGLSLGLGDVLGRAVFGFGDELFGEGHGLGDVGVDGRSRRVVSVVLLLARRASETVGFRDGRLAIAADATGQHGHLNLLRCFGLPDLERSGYGVTILYN
jgi:hypothetical protein